MSEKQAKKARQAERAKLRATPIAIDARGGTPGRKPVDQWSRPSDARGMVEHLAQELGVERSEVASLVSQASQDIGTFIKQGWDPHSTAHLLCLEIAMSAVHSQTSHDVLAQFVAAHVPLYYDAVSRHMEKQGETHEVRDAMQGVAVDVARPAYPH